jgi:hypothetical protein
MMPTEHAYIVLLGEDPEHRQSYDDPEAFGVFHHYDDARAYADKLVADNPHLTAAVLPVKPAE